MQCFPRERGASVGADYELLNFQDLLHTQEHKKTLKERGGGRKAQ